MRINLLVTGKTDAGWVGESLEQYASRLHRYVNFELTELPYLKNASSLSKDTVKQKEGEQLLRAVGENDCLVLLDERGEEFTSLEFARYLESKMSHLGAKALVFAIGGAYGFSDKVYARANGKISLSKMTFPHQLVRTIFAEQLYRAFAILHGDPYHHE